MWKNKIPIPTIRLLTILLLLIPTLHAADHEGGDGPPRKTQRRILTNWDMSSFEQCLFYRREKLSPESVQRRLEEAVDEHAAAQVDAFVHCVFIRFYSHLMGPSKVTNRAERYRKASGVHVLDEAGIDFLKVLIDRCHQRDMEFIATLRMNSSHGNSNDFGQWFKEHPQYRLKGQVKVDYTHDAVRDAMLTFIGELLDGYDVDGIDFDWMRWTPAFPVGEGPQKAHLLTDFTRKARALLDEAARRRGGGRLVLGVRVPETMAECHYHGFDLATWISEGFVDYVVPSDFNHVNFNTRVEDFAKLTAGTACKIYPALHPSPSDLDRNVHQLTQANYRAAAQNFYAFGADGFYAFNWMYHWDHRRQARTYTGPGYFWPAALGYLQALRDPEEVSQGDRHYLFGPRWRKGASPTGEQFSKYDSIDLKRADADPQGTWPFRLAEELSDPKLRATLHFKAVGLEEAERLNIQVNGTPVPREFITRVIDPSGQNESQGRVLPPFYWYFIDLDRQTLAPAVVHGDNELTVRLIRPEAEGEPEGTVAVEDLGAYVYVRRTPAAK